MSLGPPGATGNGHCPGVTIPQPLQKKTNNIKSSYCSNVSFFKYDFKWYIANWHCSLVLFPPAFTCRSALSWQQPCFTKIICTLVHSLTWKEMAQVHLTFQGNFLYYTGIQHQAHSDILQMLSYLLWRYIPISVAVYVPCHQLIMRIPMQFLMIQLLQFEGGGISRDKICKFVKRRCWNSLLWHKPGVRFWHLLGFRVWVMRFSVTVSH